MNFKLVSASVAAALALGAGSLAAKAAPIGAGLIALQSDGSLVQKAGYGDNDHRGWRWRHHRVDDDHRDGGSHWWWWRHHRVDRDDSHHVSRDRDERSDRNDHRHR